MSQMTSAVARAVTLSEAAVQLQALDLAHRIPSLRTEIMRVLQVCTTRPHTRSRARRYVP
jgi:hypothetical protein